MKIRDRVPRGLGWWARAWVSAVVAWAVVAVLAVLPLGAGTVQQAYAGTSGVTVDGPPVWIPDLTPDPNTGFPTGAGQTGANGRVSVSQTQSLRDQVLHVSWTGFTPSVDIFNNPQTVVVSNPSSPTIYPVQIFQCRGADPSPTDCYGADFYGGDPKLGFQQKAPAAGVAPEYPSNAVNAVTAPDGTGQADIEVWSATQSQTLGCDATHQCSLVVLPWYGGDALSVSHFGTTDSTPACDNHAFDRDSFFNEASLAAVGVGNHANTQFMTGEACAWANKVTVPLSFAPTDADCKAAATDFKMAGLEMANRAVQQWRSGFCQGDGALNIDYTYSGGEPQARSAFLRDAGPDVALTTRADSGAAPRPYVYAPLANTAISVAFLVDDPSGLPVHQMRLNARLMAKLLTQSYSGVPPHTVASGVPGSVAGNPTCLYTDPEFLALNPPPTPGAPSQWPTCASSMGTYPTVVGGKTDLVYQLTSWIAADPQAEAFLQGAPDDWGMHVDPFYQRPTYSGYPTDSFTIQDTSGTSAYPDMKAYDWIPQLGGLLQVARRMLSGAPGCQNYQLDVSKHDPCPTQPVGQRTLIAIMDSGQATALSMPTAQLLNPAGSFVAPSLASMQAAVSDMPTDPVTGTQTLPYGTGGTAFAKDAAAYP